MFNTLRRIIRWTGTYKRRLFAGFVYSFLATAFAAMPIMAAAYALNQVIADMRGEKEMQPDFPWLMLAAIVVLVLLRFLFSYLRAKAQESIGHEVAAEQRIEIGGILKRVPMGYFSENSIGDVSAAVTTELSTLELMGMKMIDAVVNGYISVLAILLCLVFFSLPIALIAAAGVLLSALFLRGISRKSERSAPVNHRAQEDMIAGTIQYIRGMAVVKSFHQHSISIEGVKKA